MAHYYSGGAGGKLSAVDAILAEAADLVALEQIAKLNTAHLADDSALPSTLEARFRKLKSLPSAAAPPPPVRTLTRSVTAPGPAAALPDPNPPAPAPPEHHLAPAVHEDPPPPPPLPGDAETKCGGSSPREARAPAPAPAVHDADAEDGADDLERLFGSGPRGRPTLRERNRGRDSSSSASPSPPPQRQACCFGFSPKKPLQRTPSSKAKKKVHHGSGDVLGVDADEWGDENRRMATELREQQRRLRKALEDQVQVSRETAKMARWVKQASARMTHVEAIDDLLSDCEDDEELK